MSGDREKIFGRIREALSASAPRHHEAAGHRAGPAGPASFREWLPKVGATFADQLAQFAGQCELVRTELQRCAGVTEAAAHLDLLAAAGGWKKLALHPGALTDAVAAHLPASLELLRIEAEYDKSSLEASDAGLTECESLIGQTGSICVSSRSSGGRSLSVLPPHHIVLARCEQLVGDLTAAYERLAARYAPNYPSFISFITGPSRTGDIERILVLGAHGPKKLTVLLLP
jgi:L-lactate dehydrogenase complex protein LldG